MYKVKIAGQVKHYGGRIMTYTFDEAIEELRLAIPEKFYNPTLHDIAVMLETQTKVINLLREEYAPTVEMTKVGKNYLLYYLENSSFGSFISDINLARSGTIRVEPTDYFEDLSDEDLMQAWIHPETIKLVDE